MANTLRDIRTAVVEVLQDHADMIGVDSTVIQALKFGTIPAIAPFVWVHAHPSANSALQDPTGMNVAEVELYVALQSDDELEICELAERCFQIIAEHIPMKDYTHVQFDAMYDDYGVAYFSIFEYYSLSEVL